jgi:adenylosuccinate synthase
MNTVNVDPIDTSTRFFTERQKGLKIIETGGFCEVCNVLPISQFHHIVAKLGERLTTYENMAGICDFCHKIIHMSFDDGREGFESFKKMGGCVGLGIDTASMFFVAMSAEEFEEFKETKHSNEEVHELVTLKYKYMASVFDKKIEQLKEQHKEVIERLEREGGEI